MPSSYGTYISQLYATQYPAKVGRMVLDSPVDSTRIWYQRTLDNNIGTQRIINIYYEWVAQYDNIDHLGDRSCEVEGRINKVMEELDGTAIAGWIGQTEFFYFLVNVAYNAGNWPVVTSVVADYINDGNDSALVLYASRGGDEYIAAGLTTMCNDRPWPKEWNTVSTGFWRTYPQAPLAAWSTNWFVIPCVFWPYRNNPFVNVNGSEIGPILLNAETNAVAYRPDGIMNIRRTFPRARLVSVVDGIATVNAEPK